MKYKHSIQVVKEINATEDELWDVISQPGHLELTHPFSKSHSVTSWPGVESNDVLIYLSGLRYERYFTDWSEGNGYTLQIGGREGKKSKVIWEISSEENKTFLSITIYPHFLANTPRFFSFLPYELLIRPKLTSYLNSVLGGIDYYLVKKESVPKNHFGTHKWFS
tara:strand:+ start:34 stop:528 length:495 start_codon:yes stop_codon:yes gene_type:complete